MRIVRMCFDDKHHLFKAYFQKHSFEYVSGPTEFVALGRLAMYYPDFANLVVHRKKSGWIVGKHIGAFEKRLKWDNEDRVFHGVCLIDASFQILGDFLFSEQRSFGLKVLQGSGFPEGSSKVIPFFRKKRRMKKMKV